MATINILDASIYNLISAGEVAVNPAGVVKELIENSIDAGAKTIKVSIKKAGIEMISVTDDGCGIEKGQVRSAFLTHATSKISCVDDVYKISTLGFRGEALASISRVSKVSITTRCANDEMGVQADIDGGKFIKEKDCACNVGTQIVVSSLFYNTPARLKFLNQTNVEQRLVNKIVENLIIANPNIRFVYEVDGILKHRTTGTGIENTICETLGREYIEKSVKIDVTEDNYSVFGYCVLPSFEVHKRCASIYINGRYIENTYLYSSVASAYANLVMHGVDLCFVLFINIPYDEVDVNVTPQKTDVKFQDKEKVYGLITQSVKNALYNSFDEEDDEEDGKDLYESKIYEKRPNNREENEASFADNLILAEKVAEVIGKNQVTDQELRMIWEEERRKLKESASTNVSPVVKISEFTTESDDIIPNQSYALNSDSSVMAQVKAMSSNILVKQEYTQQNFIKDNHRVLGTVFQTYIIVQGKENMYIIDQHAAHERFLYDKYMNEIQNSNIEIQYYLCPYIINADHDLANFLDKNMDLLKSFGFMIEYFGNDVYKIDGVPKLLIDINMKEFIHDIFQNTETAVNIDKQLRERIAMRACKNAIKAGMTLDESEINKIIEMIENSKSPLLCPHGRPYVLKISKSDIEKWFKRIV